MQYFYKTSLATMWVLGAVALFLSPPRASAQASSNFSEARSECKDALQIPEDLLDVGTYSIRMQNCIRQRTSVNLSKSRSDRLHRRVNRLLNRSNRNSRSIVRRRYLDAPPQPTQQELFTNIQYRPQDTYYKLLRGRQYRSRYIGKDPMGRNFPQQPAIRRANLQQAMDACAGIGGAREKSLCVERERREFHIEQQN